MIVHPAPKYVVRGKVVPAQSIAPWALGNGRNNPLAIPAIPASIRQAHRIGHPVGLGRLPAAANVFVRAVKLSIEGRIVGCFSGVWGGGSIGALLLLAEGVTPLLLNHCRRVGFPTTLCMLSRGRSLHIDGAMVSTDQHAS